MDPLSDVLALLRPRNYLSGGLDLGGEWAVEFPQYQGIKCYAVASGYCWLAVEGLPDRWRMEAGDCFLLPSGKPFQLGSDLEAASIDFHTLLTGARAGGVITYKNGGSCFLIAGYFVLDGNHTEILLDTLPPVVHIRAETDRGALRWSLEQLREESREQQPGWSLVSQHLAYTVLVRAIRLHLEERLEKGIGWLFAIADKQLGLAMNAMHEQPAHRWTLQMLAERAGMSRTIFASRFKAAVGSSPMEYLTRWRMLLAGDRLKNTDESVSEIATSLGYESESAFSKAFRRTMGRSPRQYARAPAQIPAAL